MKSYFPQREIIVWAYNNLSFLSTGGYPEFANNYLTIPSTSNPDIAVIIRKL